MLREHNGVEMAQGHQARQNSNRRRRWFAAVTFWVVMAAAVTTPTTPAVSAPVDEAPAVPAELVVGYRAGASAEQRASARRAANAELVERVVRETDGRGEVELVRFPQGADRSAVERRIEADPAVAYAEPNWIYTHAATSTDPKYTDGSLWGMYGDATLPANQFGSQAGEAWAAGNTGSANVYIGVIDEGIQYTHPDLSDQVRNPKETADGKDNDGNGYVDDVYGWDFAGKDNTIYDGGPKGTLDDHGTHVAGTIGAKANNNEGGVVGVSWNVTMISGKFLGRRGGTLANAVKAVDYFTDLKGRGVNIVATNNSWGGGGFSQALLDAITRAANANILFIAAAGNGGSDGIGDDNDATLAYPSAYDTTAGAGYDAVIAVAAIASDGEKASFSNYGANSVDLGAPGSAVWSTTAFNTYEAYSGTSMATPHVTGGAVLYAASHPSATAAAIRAAILGSTAPTPSLAGKTASGGRLNVSGF